MTAAPAPPAVDVDPKLIEAIDALADQVCEVRIHRHTAAGCRNDECGAPAAFAARMRCAVCGLERLLLICRPHRDNLLEPGGLQWRCRACGYLADAVVLSLVPYTARGVQQ